MESPISKSLQEGIEAYQSGSFEQSIDLLKNGLQEQPNHWHSRFFLAMAYARIGKQADSKREFLSIRDLCPDAELRKKAASAIMAMSSTAQTRNS